MQNDSMLYIKSRSRLLAVVFFVLTLSTMGLLQATTWHSTSDPLLQPENRLEYARALYRQYQWSRAYGHFVALADQGDAEAACVALFMVRQGTDLYGHPWSATQYQIQRWIRISRCRTESFIADGGD